MIYRLLLWGSVGWLPILMYIMHRNETKFKKNLVIGVTLPYQAREDEAVQSILNRFLKQARLIAVGLILLIIPGMMFKSFNLQISLWNSWILLAISLPYIPYVRTNRRLKQLKIERGWKLAGSELVRVQPAAIPNERWLSPWLFLPPFIISLLPLIWWREVWLMCLIMALSIVFYWFGYRYLYRNKSEIVDCNPELTRVLTRLRRYYWGQVWLITAYGTGLMSLLLGFIRYGVSSIFVATIVIAMLMSLLALRAEFKIRRLQEKLTQGSGREWYVDEDDHWLGGLFYYNPNDAKLIVNNRIGLNSSFNLAKTSGKTLSGIMILFLLSLPLSGVFLDWLGNQSIEWELSQTELTSRKYQIGRADIKSVELLEQLPQGLIRIMGNGLERQLSGNFSAPDYGSMKLFLDPTVGPFVLVKTNNQTYLIGTRDPAGTRQLYHQLREIIK